MPSQNVIWMMELKEILFEEHVVCTVKPALNATYRDLLKVAFTDR